MTDEQGGFFGMSPTGIYTLENGATVTIYNPHDCYLTWADGLPIKSYTEQMKRGDDDGVSS